MHRFLLQDTVKPGSHLSVDSRVRNKPVPLHWHNYIELELITGGSGWQKLNGIYQQLKRGSLCLLRLTDFHELTPEPQLEILNLSVAEGFLSGELLERLTQGNAIMLDLDENQTRTMEQLLLLCAEENTQKIPDSVYLQHLLSCILLRIFKLEPEQHNHIPNTQHPFQSALLYLHMHFPESPKLADLARIAHYNASHYSTVFHRELGITYSQYLNNLKIEYAKELLVSTNLKITEVSQKCGFRSHANFLRLLQADTGLSPTQYRKKNTSTGQ